MTLMTYEVIWGGGVVVSELSGHSSVAITADIYGHVLPEMRREVVKKVGDLYGGRKV